MMPSLSRNLLLLLVLTSFQTWAEDAVDDDAVKIEKWCCRDYVNPGGCSITLGGDFESNIGVFRLAGAPVSESTFTEFKIAGINRRWDWGDDGEYAFTIGPNETGRYYNFRGSAGKMIKPSGGLFKCERLNPEPENPD